MKKTTLTLFLLVLIAWQPTQASNFVRESHIAKHIKENINGGEIVELNAGTRKFLAIYRESVLPLTQGGVIILHDINQNPDSPGIIRTLRNDLIESGWDTLSVQMPVTDMHAHRDRHYNLLPIGMARIGAAANFFAQKNNFNIGVVAHGFGANHAVQYLADAPAETIKGVILIGMDSENKETLENLKKIKLPLLDIYGSEDLPKVIDTAHKRQRAVASSAGNLQYQQYRQIGADHYFNGLTHTLANVVSSWLNKYIAGNQIQLNN